MDMRGRAKEDIIKRNVYGSYSLHKLDAYWVRIGALVRYMLHFNFG
jgi:hypothetical protein